MVWILELLHFPANNTLTLGLKTQLTFGGINFLAFFHYSKTLVFEGKNKMKPPNVVGASSSLLDIYTKCRHMPKVGAFPLMTKYDNKWDTIVRDPSLVSALPDSRSDQFCPIPYQIGSISYFSVLLDGNLQQHLDRLQLPS